MKYGFVRAAAYAPDIRVADPGYNCAKIKEAITAANEGGADLLLLPALCLTGATCGDLFLHGTLTDAAEKALADIAEFSRGTDMLICLGLPVLCGHKLYDAAAVLFSGEILGIVPKTYSDGDYFAPAPDKNSCVHIAGRDVPFGAKLLFRCDDMPSFTVGVELSGDIAAPVPPSSGLAQAGAAIILNPAAYAETADRAAERRLLVSSASKRAVCGYIYADASDGESSTDLVFSGHCISCENGVLLSENKPFSGDMLFADIDAEMLISERMKSGMFGLESDGYDIVRFTKPAAENPFFSRKINPYPFIPEDKKELSAYCAKIMELQAQGLKKRLRHINCKSMVLNISGGLDSTLALLVSVKAADMLGLDRDAITALSLPCFGTTSRTKNNAEALCRALRVSFREINIKESVLSHFRDIGQSPDVYDVTYENAQARERTQVAMDAANMTGGIVIGTGDLSELMLGWATYNGDHMSMYGVNGAVPKTLIRHIVRCAADSAENDELRSTLLDILDTPVSPELLPANEDSISQKTEDLVGPYDLHDFFIYYFLRYGFGPKKIYFLAKKAFEGMFDDDTIKKWLCTFLRRFFTQQFKRSCLPDGAGAGALSVSPRGGLRMPSDASYAAWLREAEEL